MKTRKYEVQPGDTLGDISRRLYGRDIWPQLYRMNYKTMHEEQMKRDKSKTGPNWIYPGMVLDVPDEASETR